MDSNECELPPLLHSSSPKRRRHNNGRHSRCSDSGNSSDSPFFSSDDLVDASAEKYVSPASKKQYRRAWYEPEEPSRVHSHQDMRNATRRPKDSGIFMNSDDSSNSADDGFSVDALKINATKQASAKMTAFMTPPEAPKLTHDYVVQLAVTECLEEGKETLDLANCGLSFVPNDAIQPLRNHIRHPRFDPSAYTEESLQALVPSLKVFLSGNSLTSVPSEFFDLESLSCLSVRRNLITQIPHAIGRLHNLKEFNVAGNQLRWLPWELVGLVARGTLQSLYAKPNPLITHTGLKRRHNGVPWEEPLRIVYYGSTTAAFFELDGKLCKDSQPAPSLYNGEVLDTCSTGVRPPLRHQAAGSTQSLFDIALQACIDSPALADLGSYLPDETPNSVRQAVSLAQKVSEEGGRQCSVCHRRYVIARAEWIEYWFCVEHMNDMEFSSFYKEPSNTLCTLPFLRRVCSWDCAAKAKPEDAYVSHSLSRTST